MDHPPYSSCLAPSDSWFFEYIKHRRDDLQNAESLESQIIELDEKIVETTSRVYLDLY